MSGPVILLPREVRLVVERVLLLTSLPIGVVPAVRDAVLYSAAAGLGGLARLRDRYEAIRAPDPSTIRVAEAAPARITVEAGGQHAWVALPAILDALGEAVARHGAAVAEVTGTIDPDELRAACALGTRAGLSVFAASGPCAGPATGPAAELIAAAAPVVLMATPAGVAEDLVLRRALRDGVAVEPELWWALHHLSNGSLSRDTPESRRHAGPVIVEADGHVIGRKDLDDETDLSMLTHPKNPEAA